MDSTPLLQGALGFPSADTPPAKQSAGRPRSGPVTRANVQFPGTDSRATTAPQVPTVDPAARPGGSHPRTNRPGLRP
jgi:hypothetical protein